MSSTTSAAAPQRTSGITSTPAASSWPPPTSSSQGRLTSVGDIDLVFHLVTPDATFTSDNVQAVQHAYSSPRAGTVALTWWLPIVKCRGGQAQAVLECDTPWPLGVRGTHEICWQKQPGTVADTIEVIWNDSPGHIYRTSGDPGQDRVMTLTMTGVTLAAARLAQGTLPSLNLGWQRRGSMLNPTRLYQVDQAIHLGPTETQASATPCGLVRLKADWQ